MAHTILNAYIYSRFPIGYDTKQKQYLKLKGLFQVKLNIVSIMNYIQAHELRKRLNTLNTQ